MTHPKSHVCHILIQEVAENMDRAGVEHPALSMFSGFFASSSRSSAGTGAVPYQIRNKINWAVIMFLIAGPSTFYCFDSASTFNRVLSLRTYMPLSSSWYSCFPRM